MSELARLFFPGGVLSFVALDRDQHQPWAPGSEIHLVMIWFYSVPPSCIPVKLRHPLCDTQHLSFIKPPNVSSFPLLLFPFPHCRSLTAYPPGALHPRRSGFRPPFAPFFALRVMEPDIGQIVKGLSGYFSRKRAVQASSSLYLYGRQNSERSPSDVIRSGISLIPVTSDCLTLATCSFDVDATGEHSHLKSAPVLAFDDNDSPPPIVLRLAIDLASGSELHLAWFVELVQGALYRHPIYTIRYHRP